MAKAPPSNTPAVAAATDDIADPVAAAPEAAAAPGLETGAAPTERVAVIWLMPGHPRHAVGDLVFFEPELGHEVIEIGNGRYATDAEVEYHLSRNA